MLRKRVADEKYNPKFRARAAATLTALAEYILATKQPSTLDMLTISQPSKKGIEFCLTTVAKDAHADFDQLATETVGIVDEIDHVQGPDQTRIFARVWFTE
ncbi:MAG TPA: hypothetical protein VKQ72_15195 [Aggregatilineales bacterium]|nr:hypothetical protein [Aggregatilineales bacterium]